MLIPHRDLSTEALQGLVEEFVTREGTDYGEGEFTLSAKVAQVMEQLDSGRVVIVWDPESGSATLQLKA